MKLNITDKTCPLIVDPKQVTLEGFKCILNNQQTALRKQDRFP